MGILNGTANFILTEMTTRGMDFGTALRMAQDKGYAEADPTLDIEGVDAAHQAGAAHPAGPGPLLPPWTSCP